MTARPVQPNIRFSEYATSGAFSLNLTRNQVASLALLEPHGGSPDWTGSMMAALERKGLVERWPAPKPHTPDRIEYRATLAGLLTSALCREAGLHGGQADPVATEIARLKAEVIALRGATHQAQLDALSSLSRLQETETELANVKAQRDGGKLKIRMHVRDPQPDVDTETLRQRAQMAEVEA